MATVIDTSVMGAQFLPDEAHSSLAQVLLKQLDTENLIVPRIFWYEIRNVLLKAKRNGRIEQRDFEACLTQLTDEFALSEDGENDTTKMLDLAQRHNLTVYDASYLETAIRHKAKLATFDKKLATAAAKEKVEEPAVQSTVASQEKVENPIAQSGAEKEK